MSTTHLYLEATSALLDRSMDLKRNHITPDEFIKYHKKLTLDNFLFTLYSIFDALEMISKPEYGELANRNKFIYTGMVPDYPNETIIDNVVTFEITGRAPAVFDTKAVPGKTTQHKPRYLFEIDDININQKIAIYNMSYDNEVKFTVWSEKMEDAMRIASFLENFFVKYNKPLGKHVGQCFYRGRLQTIVSSDYGKKRLFGIPLVYFIRTDELCYFKEDEIISIDEIVEVAHSSAALEELFSLKK